MASIGVPGYGQTLPQPLIAGARVTFTNRFHRTTAIAAGTFVALAAALMFGAPASAAAKVPPPPPPPSDLTSSASCDPTGWTVTWKLKTGSSNGAVATFKDVRFTVIKTVTPPVPGDATPPYPTPAALKTFTTGGTAPGDTTITESQTLDAGIATVELGMRLSWPVETNVVATAAKPAGCHDPDLPPPPPGGGPLPSASAGASASASASASPSVGPSASTTPVPLPHPIESPTPTPIPAPSLTTEPAGTGGLAGGGSTDDGSTGGGGLALTGAAAGFLGTGAALIVLVGAALFVITRRRKVKFTA
jgi:hypothetical protein